MVDSRHDNTAEPRLERAHGRSQGFLKGLFGGVLMGAVAGVLFAPQISATLRGLRRHLTDAATDTSDAAGERFREVTTRVSDAVGDLQEKGHGVYGKALSAVVRGAEDVKERATEAQARRSS